MVDTQVADSQTQECIVECDSCHDVCVETMIHGLTIGGGQAAVTHVRSLMDCAQMCQTASEFMLRESPLHRAVCHVCAEACDACAVSCAEVGGAEMKACAEACRRCAEACRRQVSVA